MVVTHPCSPGVAAVDYVGTNSSLPPWYAPLKNVVTSANEITHGGVIVLRSCDIICSVISATRATCNV